MSNMTWDQCNQVLDSIVDKGGPRNEEEIQLYRMVEDVLPSFKEDDLIFVPLSPDQFAMVVKILDQGN